jgi:hypothetical protein
VKIVKMSRFGEIKEAEIEENVFKSIPKHTRNTKSSIWKQLMEFCAVRKYSLTAETTVTDRGHST